MGFENKLKRAHKAAQSAPDPVPALLGKSPDLIMATVIDIFHKVGHTGGGPIFPAALVHELVPGSDLVAGFSVFDDRFCFANVWVERAGEQYDPGTAIIRLLNEGFADPVTLSKSPKGPRVDQGDNGNGNRSDNDEETAAAQDRDAEESFALYMDDPAAWWGRAPPEMVRIRKLLRVHK